MTTAVAADGDCAVVDKQLAMVARAGATQAGVWIGRSSRKPGTAGGFALCDGSGLGQDFRT
eukprot:6867920-Pyramimonas_sp.AAC.1